MTIGEKIAKLRTALDISQEQLAEKVSVSRQAVSKWEMDQSLPQIDKVLLLCELFGVSTDALLRDEIEIGESLELENRKNKYFGTDGFRGEANVGLTSDQAYKVGRFLGWYYSSPLSGCGNSGYRPRIVIGKDTRRSSYMLEYSIAAGITASGADAYMLHVTTTPSVSYVTRQDEFDCGIMITASHNPYYDNGIKVINRFGEKLDDKTTALIESYIDNDFESLGLNSDLPFATGDKIGRIVDYSSGRNRYIGYLISLASNSYKDLKIGIDSANGAAWMIAKSVFGALGAQTVVIGAEPDGLNVNNNCGSTHIENLCDLVREKHLDCGFAFDGDADRCIAVDEKGNVIDGDFMLYILGRRLKSRGMLNKDTVVATIMTNSGVKKSLEKLGITTLETKVGDRFVYECMQKGDFSLGGEQSGHIILKKYATTGDGILTAIMLAEEICDTKRSLSDLAEDVFLYPQHLENIKVSDKAAVMSSESVKKALSEIEEKIDGKGRVLLRESGTEPKIRIMVECESEEKCKEYAFYIADVIKSGGWCIE
ncbi:MAG: phosphoglucosamine mutase [Ruminococcaceae bacterium]|nr:phosphoglucosamine mutase [Oscillospiraceae bacterium]